MRKLLLFGTLLLTLSGLTLTAAQRLGWWENQTAVASFHIWLGLFYLVIFPMYSFDHIRLHRRWLKRADRVSLSGGLQLISGGLLILTGMILLLFGTTLLWVFAEIHLLATFLIWLGLALHFRASRE